MGTASLDMVSHRWTEDQQQQLCTHCWDFRGSGQREFLRAPCIPLGSKHDCFRRALRSLVPVASKSAESQSRDVPEPLWGCWPFRALLRPSRRAWRPRSGRGKPRTRSWTRSARCCEDASCSQGWHGHVRKAVGFCVISDDSE